jgi:hypothetical protein
VIRVPGDEHPYPIYWDTSGALLIDPYLLSYSRRKKPQSVQNVIWNRFDQAFTSTRNPWH